MRIPTFFHRILGLVFQFRIDAELFASNHNIFVVMQAGLKELSYTGAAVVVELVELVELELVELELELVELVELVEVEVGG